MQAAPMRQPTARRKLIPVPVNVAAVVARPVCVVIANAGAYDGSIISRPVIVRIRITVRVCPIIACRIITGVVCYVRPLCTSAQKSRHQPCAKDRQQYCSATLGFHSRFHEISPFSIWFPSCCWSLRQESRRPARCFIVRFESGASIGRRLGEISGTLWTAARCRGRTANSCHWAQQELHVYTCAAWSKSTLVIQRVTAEAEVPSIVTNTSEEPFFCAIASFAWEDDAVGDTVAKLYCSNHG